MSTGHNFRYIQFKTPVGIGYACVSLTWEKVDSKISYTAGISFCSPKDVFNKHRAREMADNRRIGARLKSRNMNHSGLIAAIEDTKFISNSEFDKVLRDLMTNLSVRPNSTMVPNWASKAFHGDTYILGLTQDQSRSTSRKLSQMTQQLKIPVTLENGQLKANV